MNDISDAELELLSLIMREHDGDDRCGCITAALMESMNGCRQDALAIVRRCRATHIGWERIR